MTEEILRMYRLLDDHPESDSVKLFESECSTDLQLQQNWYDFLVEQHLSGNITDQWKNYILWIPQLHEQIEFQEQVQLGIKKIQERNTKGEIRRILPKRHIDGVNRSGRTPRFIFIVVSAAAVALICIVVFMNQFYKTRAAEAVQYAGVPVVMIEPLESEGVTEDMLVHGIPQRIPTKLSAATGIYPVTYYAVDRATIRARVGETPQGIVNATHTMHNKVRRQGEGFLVESSLVDVAKNQELWKELFPVENNPKAFDDLHDELSLRVAHVLNVAINASARARLTMEVSNNIDAMNLFLEGERKWAERTEASLEESIRLFQEALDIDSTSTIIRGYLALAYETYAENGYGEDEDWKRAISEAEKTLRMDQHNPEALVVLGYYAYSEEKDYRNAGVLFAQALKVQPGDAKIHQAIAELYLRTGEIAIGREHILTARAIEPEHRVMRWVETKYLTAYGRLEDAKTATDDLRHMYPGYPNIRNFNWQYHLTRGEYDKAVAAISKDSDPIYWRGLVYLAKQDFNSLYALYPDGPVRKSFVLLEHIQKDEWEEAYVLLHDLLKNKEFDLLPIFQSSDFAMFNKMKKNTEVQRILLEYGIKTHMIPKYVEPEI